MTDDLLKLAMELTYREQGRPKQVSMRSAMSLAYYGLFHALLETFANEVVGRNAAPDDYAAAYRFPEHASLPKRLTEVSDPAVKAIAATLKLLQDHRLKADYDPRPFAMGKGEVRDSIIEAKEAANAVRSLKPKQRKAIVAALLSTKRR